MQSALLLAVAFVLGGLAAIVSLEPREAAAPAPAAAILKFDADGFRYTYQVLTGDEALFEIRTDPRELHDVLRSHPALARDLRHALESQLHVDSMETLRRDRGDTIRALRTLGYL